MEPPRIVFVPYITNRRMLRHTTNGPEYSERRNPSLNYGIAQVSVPPRHARGCLETPQEIPLLGWEYNTSVERHVLLTRTQDVSPNEFLRRLASRVQASPVREVLVFVHGYNVSFPDAARRVAQLTADLQFGGVVVLFSWPSNGSALAYLPDQTDADASVHLLEQALTQLRRGSGARALHVVAHSMGNRIVTEALSNLGMRGQRVVDEVVFTAPDVDRDVFLRRLPHMRRAAARLTLYASASDLALKASRRAAEYARAGQAGRELILAEEVETVDATRLTMDFLGHSYFVSEPVLDDLQSIVRDRWPPGKRGLREQRMPKGRYWLFVIR